MGRVSAYREYLRRRRAGRGVHARQRQPGRPHGAAGNGRADRRCAERSRVRASRPGAAGWRAHPARHSAAARGRHDRRHGSDAPPCRALHRQARRDPQDLRRPGGDRHPECPPVHGDPGEGPPARECTRRGAGAEQGPRGQGGRLRSTNSSASAGCAASSRRSSPRPSSRRATRASSATIAARSWRCSATCAASPPSPRPRSPRTSCSCWPNITARWAR